jgi:transcriptional regulator with XRE-family HTH domain
MGLSQRELARRASVVGQTTPFGRWITEYEAGTRWPSLRTLCALSDALGITPIELLEYTDYATEMHRRYADAPWWRRQDEEDPLGSVRVLRAELGLDPLPPDITLPVDDGPDVHDPTI